MVMLQGAESHSQIWSHIRKKRATFAFWYPWVHFYEFGSIFANVAPFLRMWLPKGESCFRALSPIRKSRATFVLTEPHSRKRSHIRENGATFAFMEPHSHFRTHGSIFANVAPFSRMWLHICEWDSAPDLQVWEDICKGISRKKRLQKERAHIYQGSLIILRQLFSWPKN